MKLLIKGFYLLLLAFIVGSFFYLMYGEIPAPVTNVEKVIPNDRFGKF